MLLIFFYFIIVTTLLNFCIKEQQYEIAGQMLHGKAKTLALFSTELLPCMEKTEAHLVLLVIHTLLENSHIPYSSYGCYI